MKSEILNGIIVKQLIIMLQGDWISVITQGVEAVAKALILLWAADMSKKEGGSRRGRCKGG
jgi:hypothetical protein